MNSNGIQRLTRRPEPFPHELCPRCGGDGRREASTDRGIQVYVCPVCEGEGRVDPTVAAHHDTPDRRLFELDQ
jgi:DnaJ-class molecular chaperone